ncbi:unnamed protein product [Closterium sp. NIES-54]
MVQHVLQRFDFTYSSPQATPLSTRHSLSALPSDESVEPSGPYPELVGFLMYLMTCTRPDLAYPLSILARYVAPGRHRPEHMAAAKRVLRYLCSTSGLGLVLGGRCPVVLTGHADASWADDQATQWSSQGYTFSLGSGSVSWRSTRSSSVLGSSCEAEIYTGAMAAQELRWLTYLLTDLGEPPRSPPVLYVDNKAMLALYREHRLEHRTKHFALRYFLARELQQRGQLSLAYVASEANTVDIFTKALPLGDHQRFCTMLGFPTSLFTTGTSAASSLLAPLLLRDCRVSITSATSASATSILSASAAASPTASAGANAAKPHKGKGKLMPVCCQMLCPRAACTASMPPTIALPCAARTRLSCPALTCCPAPPANALPCTLPATRTRASPPLPSIPHADLPYSPRDVCPAARALPCLAPLAACAPAASALPAAVPARCLHSQCTARTLSAPPLRALPALQLLLSYWCRLPRACPALPWTGALLLRCCYCAAATGALLLLLLGCFCRLRCCCHLSCCCRLSCCCCLRCYCAGVVPLVLPPTVAAPGDVPLVLPPTAAALGAAATRVHCPALPFPALAPPCPECCYVATTTCAATACATVGPAEPPCHAAFAAAAAATALATATAAGMHQYLHSVTQDIASLFEHMSGSLPVPEAPAEPAAVAGEGVRTQFHVARVAYKRWMACDAAAKLGVRAHLSQDQRAHFRQVPSAHAFYTTVGGRSGAGGSGGGGHQELEPSYVAACAPTSTVYAHPPPVLSCLVVPSASSGSTEGGHPTAANTTTSRRSPRLETPLVFPPLTSSPPLQPVVADFGGPCVVGGGDAEGSGSGGAGSEGAASRGARSPLVGGVGGTGTGGAGARGAGSGGALQTLPRRSIFLEQPSSSLPEPTPTCTTPSLLFPPPDSPLPAPARYVPLSIYLTGRQVPVSCAASPATPHVPREPVVLPLLTLSSLPAVLDPVSDLARAARLTIPCCLATLVTAPTSSPAAASALVAELASFAATCRRAYLAGLVSASSCPPSIGGELAFGRDVLEDRQFELECLSYPLSIRTRYAAPGRHHPAHWQAARRVLRYLVGLASRT